MYRSICAIVTALFISAVVAVSFVSCSCSSSQPARQKVSAKVMDKKAYSLGEEHARRIIEIATDEDKVQDGLLEIRARMSNIESKLSRQSAVDYERGFTDYIRSNCDSLALILF